MSVNSNQAPLALGSQAVWSGVSLEHCFYPAYETPEYTAESHEICVYVGQPIIYEQLIEGKLRSHSCIYGDMIIYPAGLTQKLSWNKQAETIQLSLKPELLTQACQDWLAPENIEIIPQFQLRDPLIQQLALTFLRELPHSLSNNSNNNLYLDSLANTLYLHLLRHYSRFQNSIIEDSYDGLPSFLLRRLVEYIQANLAQNLTLLEMATVVNLSTSHLNRLFKQSQGISLYQFVIRCRIERAKQLLKQPQLTIAEIATQVGFADQSHLTHHFKRHLGVTPKTFRQL
jgi:AraC family transcriptional regulator